MSIDELFKKRREELLKQIDKVNSALSLYNVQYDIAKEIIESEIKYKELKEETYKLHINLLRNYADTFTWVLLHSHTVRQLHKNSGPPQSLLHQGHDFIFTLEEAKRLAEEGNNVLIADITNCIKIGDIIICNDPKKPIIIECKNSSYSRQKLTSGRITRQITRGIKTWEYLCKGTAKFYNEPGIRVVIEIKEENEYNWKIINNTVHAAIDNGFCIGIIDDSDIIWAFRRQIEVNKNEVLDKIKNFKIITVGCHIRALEEVDLLCPPPSCWPIDFECRFLLMESDIVLMHAIDANQFTKVKYKKGRIKTILMDKEGFKNNCFVVDIKGKEVVLSSRFLKDVLYNFASIRSITKQMISFAQKSNDRLKKIGKNELEKFGEVGKLPYFHFLETLDDIQKLYLEKEKCQRNDYVVVSKKLLESIAQRDIHLGHAIQGGKVND